jgi:hypothetical protein
LFAAQGVDTHHLARFLSSGSFRRGYVMVKFVGAEPQ